MAGAAETVKLISTLLCRLRPVIQSDATTIPSFAKATQLFNPRSNVNTVCWILEQMARATRHSQAGSSLQFIRSVRVFAFGYRLKYGGQFQHPGVESTMAVQI